MTHKRIVVAGCNGRFGRKFVQILSKAKSQVWGADLQLLPEDECLRDRYVCASITRPNEHLIKIVENSDWIVLCAPESEVIRAISTLVHHVRARSCVIDITSVKSRVAAALHTACPACGYLSIHPLYSPADNRADGDLVVIPLRENDATREFEQDLRGWHEHVVRLDPESHDRLTALMQVVPHVMLLAYGLMLARSNTDTVSSQRPSTTLQRTLFSLLTRMTNGSRETYSSIQLHNPYAGHARREFMNVLADIDSMAAGGRMSGFTQAVDSVARYLERCSRGVKPLILSS